ncbi:hypothetical protein ACWGJ6_02515 [Streptomyces canus]
MAHLAIHRERRAKRRDLRSALRRRATATRLVASVKRRPRSLATVALAAGVDRDTASGIASGLRSVAKRIGIAPAKTARTRRTVNGGRGRKSRTVYRFTLRQVARLLADYRPRKQEFKAAVLAMTVLVAA